MAADFTIRIMQPEDSQALLALEDKTADTGRIGFFTSYEHDYYQVQKTLRPEFVGIVAETGDHQGLVGVAMMTMGECQVEGQRRPYAYLNGLGVHQDYRRRGMGTGLSLKLVDLARERIGDEGIIFAGIQGGNQGSLITAKRWINQCISGRTTVAIGRARKKPPGSVDRLTVRRARAGELEEIAKKQNAFYRETNLYPTKTAEDLEKWLSQRPFGIEINRYYVAVDDLNNLHAGMGVTLEGFLLTTHLVRMPWFMKVANKLLRLFPANGKSRRLNGHWFWFEEGKERAGVYLWESVCWLERETATMAMMFMDSAGPIKKIIPQPRFVPSSGGYLVLNSPVQLSEDRALYFNNVLV